LSWKRISKYFPLCLYFKFDNIEYRYVIEEADHDIYDRVMFMYARDIYGSEKALNDPDQQINVLNHARRTLQNVFYEKAKADYKRWKNEHHVQW